MRIGYAIGIFAVASAFATALVLLETPSPRDRSYWAPNLVTVSAKNDVATLRLQVDRPYFPAILSELECFLFWSSNYAYPSERAERYVFEIQMAQSKAPALTLSFNRSDFDMRKFAKGPIGFSQLGKLTLVKKSADAEALVEDMCANGIYKSVTAGFCRTIYEAPLAMEAKAFTE